MTDFTQTSLISARVATFTKTGAPLGNATGFFCRYQDKTFLVTNWHVVSGKNALKSSKLLGLGFPAKCDVSFNGVKRVGNILESRVCTFKDINLYSVVEKETFDEDNPPVWHENPAYDGIVDVIAIEITHLLPHNSGYSIVVFDPVSELEKSPKLKVMDEVFIIGYPLKSSTIPNDFPIYKAGTIASEPNYFHYRPIFYVDGKTKPGMSGSPVVRRDRAKLQDNGNGQYTFSEGGIDLIGVYSGRDQESNSEYIAELGIVWHLKEGLLPILKAATEDAKNWQS